MAVPPAAERRLVVLVSGGGTNLQALIDASTDPSYGARVVAVGADRDGIEGLARARRHDIETFVLRTADFDDRAAWDVALAERVAGWRDAGRPALMVAIGGPDGLDASIRTQAELILSFGAATLPHGLVRVLALEQIYRSLTILAGHPYHRGEPG